MNINIAWAFSFLLHLVVAWQLASDFSPPVLPQALEIALISHGPGPGKKIAGSKTAKGEQGTWPELLSQPKIEYPTTWKKQNLSGAVKAKLKISSLGQVESVQILETQSNEMAELATQAMRQFQFRPASVSGKAVASEIEYSYRFILR